jgi:tripartite-type tricarboxylate transporter receptor subunit TctC
VLSNIKGGKLKAIAATGPQRWSGMLDVPTVAEQGVPGYDVRSWAGLMAPAGTPKEIVSKLNADLRSVLEMPQMKEQVSKSGMLPLEPGSVQELQVFMKSEIERWGEVVRKAGIEGSQ